MVLCFVEISEKFDYVELVVLVVVFDVVFVCIVRELIVWIVNVV